MSETFTNAASNRLSRRISVEPKHCWVCFATEDDDYSAQWLSPCKCRGTAKWVHKTCLQRWIDEKQQGNSSVEVACPQCNSTYIIVYPRSDFFVKCLDMIDRVLNKICPLVAGGVLIGSVYWTAVTYGAVTVMMVLGHKDGLNCMEKTDPLLLLLGLPSIPFFLIVGRLIRWQDALLKFWRKHSTKLFGLYLPNSSSQSLPRTPNVTYPSNSDPVSLTRTICGGLIMPTIATIIGKFCFDRFNSNFQRFLLGSFAYIGIKGALKIYYKQQQFLRQAHRQIRSFENVLNANSSQTIHNDLNRSTINSTSAAAATTSGSNSRQLVNDNNSSAYMLNNNNSGANSNNNNNNNTNNQERVFISQTSSSSSSEVSSTASSLSNN